MGCGISKVAPEPAAPVTVYVNLVQQADENPSSYQAYNPEGSVDSQDEEQEDVSGKVNYFIMSTDGNATLRGTHDELELGKAPASALKTCLAGGASWRSDTQGSEASGHQRAQHAPGEFGRSSLRGDITTDTRRSALKSSSRPRLGCSLHVSFNKRDDDPSPSKHYKLMSVSFSANHQQPRGQDAEVPARGTTTGGYSEPSAETHDLVAMSRVSITADSCRSSLPKAMSSPVPVTIDPCFIPDEQPDSTTKGASPAGKKSSRRRLCGALSLDGRRAPWNGSARHRQQLSPIPSNTSRRGDGNQVPVHSSSNVLELSLQLLGQELYNRARYANQAHGGRPIRQI